MVLLGMLLWLLGGCQAGTFVDAAQPQVADLAPNDSALGQTFVAKHAGLTGIDLYLSPTSGAAATVTLHLRTDPASQVDIVSATLPAHQITQPAFYRFSFPALTGSNGQSYYAFWETEPLGDLHTGIAAALSYLDGSMQRDHEPVDAQVAFRLVYRTQEILWDLIRYAFPVLGWVALAVLVLAAPGLALLELGGVAGKTPDWGERICLALGVGLAYYPVLLVWTHQFGLALGAWHVWLSVSAGLLILFARASLLWRGYSQHAEPDQQAASSPEQRRQLRWPLLALLLVAGLIFTIRLLVIRGLEAPLWGDSVQHAVIAQLILDHGGLFSSWNPYAPYATLTTHFGFSVVAAALAWPTDISSTQATLLAGQLVNGLAVVALYPLAKRVANGNAWAGVSAVVVAGLLSAYPAFYVNWGRYAQLTGQAILPVALWLFWLAAAERRFNWRVALLAGFTACGMVLSYYRMPYFYAVFVLAWLFCWAIPIWKLDRRRWQTGGAQLVAVGLFALILFFPWLLNLTGSKLMQSAVGASGAALDAVSRAPARSWQMEVETVLNEYRAWSLLPSFVPPLLLATSGLACLLGFWRRQHNVVLLVLWVVGLAALAATRLIGLPGARQMQSFAVLIALYLPVSLLTGWLLGELIHRLVRWRLGLGVTIAGLLLAGLWGAWAQMTIVKPEFILVTRPDVQAMSWVDQHLPPDALLLVQGFTIYNGTQAVGADSGWWLPLLAGRANTMPPQYAMFNERPEEPGYTQRIVELVQLLEANRLSDAVAIRALCDWGITHVFIGQRQGTVGFEAAQLFAPAELSDQPAFQPIYHRDLVHIYRFDRQACATNTG
jgi:hypothetical protein